MLWISFCSGLHAVRFWVRHAPDCKACGPFRLFAITSCNWECDDHVTKLKSTAGVPEPYDVRAKENEEAALLAISKLRFQELSSGYPEQLESMITSLLNQYGLTRSGDDLQGAAAHSAQQASESELMQIALKVSLVADNAALICFCIRMHATTSIAHRRSRFHIQLLQQCWTYLKSWRVYMVLGANSGAY